MAEVEIKESGKGTEEKIRKERFIDPYLEQRGIMFTILLSLYILLDITAIFVSATFWFYEIFLYIGLVMILFAVLTLIVIIKEENLVWAIIAGILMGLAPVIEIIIHLATVNTFTLDLLITILALILALFYTFTPFLSVYLFMKNKIKNQSN